MHTVYLILLVISALLSPLAHTSEVFDYADIAYSHQNTDYDGFNDSKTSTFKASASVFQWLHARARYNAGDVEMPGLKGDVQQESWAVLGVGVHSLLSDQTAIFLGLEQNQLKLQNGITETGLYYHLGFKHQFNISWQISFEVGESEASFRDTTLAFEAIYKVARQFGLSATLRDYDDLDLTEYELGLRWFFRD